MNNSTQDILQPQYFRNYRFGASQKNLLNKDSSHLVKKNLVEDKSYSHATKCMKLWLETSTNGIPLVEMSYLGLQTVSIWRFDRNYNSFVIYFLTSMSSSTMNHSEKYKIVNPSHNLCHISRILP
jgi:hypothetical protein